MASGELVVVGITQEQHPERCRLFAQWKGIDWPILHDPLNLIGIGVVPVAIAIDEHGVVRDTRPRPDTVADSFVFKKFPAPEEAPPKGPKKLPVPKATGRRAKKGKSPADWRAHGDALVLAGGSKRIGQAIEAYGKATKLDAKGADAFFRLGVAYRMRHDGPTREPGDFQAAVDAWQKALDLTPNNYIFRRRIQQYGPRLDKPYPFYDWIAGARAEITRRGQTPVELVAEPVGAEVARPARDFSSDSKKGPKGDPNGKVGKDRKGLIELTQAVVRGTGKKNQGVVQVHLALRPNAEHEAHWNNEGDPVRIWLKKPKTGRLGARFLEYPNAPQVVSDEERTLSFEVKLPSRQKGSLTVNGYALYNVCEGKEGKCLFRRQAFKVKIKL